MSELTLPPLLCSDPMEGIAGKRVIFIAAMGFEDRALECPRLVATGAACGVLVPIRYGNPKGRNREREFRDLFAGYSGWRVQALSYSAARAHEFEFALDNALRAIGIEGDDAVIVDVSAMSKFLILVTLLRLWQVRRMVRVVITTAHKYAPTKDEFEATMKQQGHDVRVVAGQPSVGVSAILRSRCMVSTRMQGQPACAVAFTSFNEELIRHATGTLNPRRLILVNGMPPFEESAWRATATQAIHSKLIEEYSSDNPVVRETGLLRRTVSTLDYRATVKLLEDLHSQYGLYERMIYFATGSKMQTVALAIHRHRHADAHVEYPTPDSYYFQEYSKGVDGVFWIDVDISTFGR